MESHCSITPANGRGFVALLAALFVSAAAMAAEPAKKALYIGIDGTRFDAVERAATPHLDALIADGVHSPTCLILGERYRKKYFTPDAAGKLADRGELAFGEIQVESLSPAAALLRGRYFLKLADTTATS